MDTEMLEYTEPPPILVNQDMELLEVWDRRFWRSWRVSRQLTRLLSEGLLCR